MHAQSLHRCGQPGRRRPPFGCCTVSLCRGGGRGGSVQAWDRRQGAGDLRAAGAPRLQRERARCKRLPVQTRTGRTEKPERWSPPSPAVPFTNHAPHQYTAETAGSIASGANGEPEHSLALSLSTKRRDKVWRRSVADQAWRQSAGTRCKCEAHTTRLLHFRAFACICVHSRFPLFAPPRELPCRFRRRRQSYRQRSRQSLGFPVPCPLNPVP